MRRHASGASVPATLRAGAKRLAVVPAQAWRWKWHLDARHLPLTAAHRTLYATIHRVTFRRFLRFPNLRSPATFNDRIQWLKLFDQSPDVIEGSDKLRAKDRIRAVLGDGYVPATLATGRSLRDIDLASLPNRFVLKTTHDSGSVVLVRDKRSFDADAAARTLDAALATRYGADKGEWHYRWIEPRVFAEAWVDAAGDARPADYKFHCVDGTVAFLQYIDGRDATPHESLADRDGRPLPEHLDPALGQGPPFRKPDAWNDLVEVAEALADGHKYVRVDLYLSHGRVVVGELTFHPRAGFYPGPGQRALGRFMTFDVTTFRPPVTSVPES
ncbi:MAG: ATP-grasp fold amidoligase family protein [Trueperaceae bacterium]|nr:ATP-grasp fold amidoligase family protein [Trueperaceae bacterium]